MILTPENKLVIAVLVVQRDAILVERPRPGEGRLTTEDVGIL